MTFEEYLDANEMNNIPQTRIEVLNVTSSLGPTVKVLTKVDNVARTTSEDLKTIFPDYLDYEVYDTNDQGNTFYFELEAPSG